MKQPISIIVCYRDRKEHLDVFLSDMANTFKDIEHEIIVVEQNDEYRFCRGALLNEGAKRAKYDLIALHDVDYIPTSADDYYGDADVIQPVKRVYFVNMDGSIRDENDIPSGYRHFINGVDDDFFGAVTVFRKSAFFKINGFNTLYTGWGLEDADLRERIKHHGLSVIRNNGDFRALPHPDSNPGLQDPAFQMNQSTFANWKAHLDIGVNTQVATTRVDGINPNHIYATNFVTFDKELLMLSSVDRITTIYEDTPEMHTYIWNGMKSCVNSTRVLKAHRDWVVQNQWGYGNRALHWQWNLLIQAVPDDFKFLEIGVFKGQTISLMSLLNQYHKKNGMIYGISPLSKSGDKYATHPDVDYEEAIAIIYGTFALDATDLELIQGYSNDPDIISTAASKGPFDIIYVDGCHDYDVVVSDLTNYSSLVNLHGYIVVDDASNYLNIPDGLIRMNWKGLPDVSNAVRDVLEKDVRFKEIFAVGHNRIFQRVQ